MEEPVPPPRKPPRKVNWLSLSGLDAAKAGLALYILGMLICGVYYARFHVLALDFTRVQSIIAGVYLVALYLALPAAFVWCAAQFSQLKRVRLVIWLVMLAALDLGLCVLLGDGLVSLPLVAFSTLLLQILLFVDWDTLRSSLRERQMALQMLHQPTRARLVILGLLVCLHFSILWFPGIPGNFAGGRPISVQIFTATQGLPNNRFAQTLNNPKINPQMDSYALWLLYQSDTDIYLLDSPPRSRQFFYYDVMRISQDQVVRMDYGTVQ